MNFKKILVLVLTFAMLMSTFAPTLGVFATAIQEGAHTHNEESKKDLIYVSIGDSMTNGYGMDGYDGESGVVNYSNNTYSNQFAAWLSGYEGAIADDQVIFTGPNGTVDHRQLAMSGMRAEDLYWALTLDYENEELMQKLYAKEDGSANWVTEVKNLWFGEFGFKAGDYRTWTDLVNADYRYADAAARILANYNGKPDTNGKHFMSSFADSTAVHNAVNGVNGNKYFLKYEKTL